MDDFASRFMRYVDGGGHDEHIYVELTERVNRMQRELGSHGVMAMYRPPFANYALRDYQILVNMLPEYRQAANNDVLQRSQAPQFAAAIRDALVRYSGSLQEYQDDIRGDLKNPLVWFRNGIRAILSSPLLILREFGVLSPSVSASILRSSVLKIGAGVVALVTLLAGIVQIVTGWDAVQIIISRWFGSP